MSKKTIFTPVSTFAASVFPAIPAQRLFHGETLDQYATKYLALLLINMGVDFNLDQVSSTWSFFFRVSEETVPTVERILATLPTARPSSDEFLAAHLYAGADAGRLDLAQSRHAVAQVASQEDTQYLADLWNAFAPHSQANVAFSVSEPVSAPSNPIFQLT